MTAPRIVLIVTWLVLASCFVVAPSSSLAGWGRVIFWIMAATHVIEFFFYLPLLRRVGGSLPAHFVQVLFFGFAYYMEVKAEAGESPAEG